MDTEIVWRFFLGKVAIIAAFAEKPRALKLGQTDRTTIRFRHGLQSIIILALDFVRSAQISVFWGCATLGKAHLRQVAALGPTKSNAGAGGSWIH